MDELVFRSIKSIVLFLVMYCSMKYLGINNGPAIVVSSIPLVLGMVNIMTGTAFSIAGLVFLLAAFSALLPSKYRNAADFADKIFNDGTLDRGTNVVNVEKEKTKQDETSDKTDGSSVKEKK
jgi:hypothetical protein